MWHCFATIYIGGEFEGLPKHELEKIYLGESPELFCLYFGDLLRLSGETEFCVTE